MADKIIFETVEVHEDITLVNVTDVTDFSTEELEAFLDAAIEAANAAE